MQKHLTHCLTHFVNDRRESHKSEAGIGLIGTSLGVLMLMGLLLIALHAMLALQARTLVSAAAWDAARAMSVEQSGQSMSPSEAKSRIQTMIPGLHPVVSFDGTSANSVSVTIDATSPGFFPGVTSFDGVRKVHRTVTMRRERVR
jgi:hypothetical protein